MGKVGDFFSPKKVKNSKVKYQALPSKDKREADKRFDLEKLILKCNVGDSSKKEAAVKAVYQFLCEDIEYIAQEVLVGFLTQAIKEKNWYLVKVFVACNVMPPSMDSNQYLLYLLQFLQQRSEKQPLTDDWFNTVSVMLEKSRRIPVNKHKQTALHLLADGNKIFPSEEKTLNLAGRMIEKGCALDALDCFGQTTVHAAATNKALTFLLVYLLEQGAERKICDEDNRTPLHVAAIHSNVSAISPLLTDDAYIDWRDAEGKTALFFAVEELEADPEETPEVSAERLRDAKQVLTDLLENGARIDIPDKRGRLPMNSAIMRNNTAAIPYLLGRGGTSWKEKLAARDSKNRTLLLFAAKYAKPEVVELLLKLGSDVEATDNSGRTPLLLAVEYGEPKAVELLLTHGANEAAVNTKRQNMSDIASRIKDPVRKSAMEVVILAHAEQAAEEPLSLST